MSVLTLVVGSPAADRAEVLEELQARHEDLVLLRAEDVRAERFGSPDAPGRHEEVEEILRQRLAEAIKTGKPVVLDHPGRAPKYRLPYLQIARKQGYRTEAVWLNIALEDAVARWPDREPELRRFERQFQMPTYAEGFARIEVKTAEPVADSAKAFFVEQEARLVKDPTGVIRELEGDGRLQSWLPELHRAIPIDQHNPHHRFTIYEHIMKATETMAGSTRKMVWTMLLHDVGKAYPGIKQFTGVMAEDYKHLKKRDRVIIENGADIREGRDDGTFYVVQGMRVPQENITTKLNGHFYEHENLGAQLAFRVLTRLGYEADFALEVATLIQFHMLLPRDEEQNDMGKMRKFYAKVGGYAGDLMWVRFADDRGK